MAHIEQSTELPKGIRGDQRRADRKPDALRVAHPARDRKQTAVRALAKKTFSVAILLPASKRQWQAGKGMPLIIDRYDL